MPKFLILRFSSIGDIVLTTPVVRCLKKQYPNAEIHFATKKQFKTLVENNPYIDKYFLLEESLKSLLKDLQSEQYDFVIDLHNNLRTFIIKTFLSLSKFSLGTRSFNKLNFQKWLLVKFKKNILPKVHIVDRYMDTLEDFGIKNDKKGLDYFIPERDEIPLEWLPETHHKGYVAYAIGGQHETKKLPLHRMIELCQKINQPIILLGGKEDFENGEKIKNSLFIVHSSLLIFNGCGKFNLNQSASLLNQASLVYTHDTGLMHIAAAFKKPIVSMWGNTVPEFGMYPYMTNFVVWENKDLNCRPCSKIGYALCPLGHFKCMEESPLTPRGGI
jgi:ADP-heptose:LPS heptosyltransferase